MAEPLTMKFTLDMKPLPSADEVAKTIGSSVSTARRHADVYEIEFEPQSEDEADAIWLMICEVGVHFPGAVLAE